MARSASSPLLSSLLGRWLPSLSQAYSTSAEQVLGTYYLGGNFGPVKDELKTVATNLPVTQRQEDGKDIPVPLPADLTGAFVRTGPNPFFKPTGGYHWFDGDGMVHSVRLAAKAGGGPVTASYINRYVQTNRLQVEKAAKYPVMFKVGDLWKGWDGLSAIVKDGLRKWQRPQDYVLGEGQANTALTFHGNRLLSMNERDLPYYLQLACNGLLETIGRLTYLAVKGSDGKVVSQEMTVHPKADSETGELWFFSYILNDPSKKPPWCRIGVLDKNGNVAKTADGTERRWQVTNAEPRVMHDWAVTKNFVFILQVPLTFTLYWQKMLTNGDSFPLDVQPAMGLKIGVMRKDAKPGAFDMKWFNLPPHMIFHVANAWEVPSTTGGGDVTVQLFSCNSMPPIDMTLESPPYAHPKLTRTTLTFDPNTLDPKSFDIKTVTDAVTCDFPIVAQHRLGLPTKYCWLGAIEPNPGDTLSKELPPVFFGIVKVDLTAEPGSAAAVKGLIRYPPNCFGGEAMYVPRDPNAGADDDDGYLLSYVHDEGTNKSYLYIYDARTMSSKEVAKIEMPQRVPYGFHSTWLTEAQVKANLVPNPIPPAA